MNDMRKALLPVFVFAKISVRRVFRDKTAMFFMFLFPLIFLFVFGNLYKSSSVSFNVALVNESNSKFSQEFEQQIKGNKLFKVNKKVTTLDDAKTSMGHGQMDAAIVLPKGFGDVANSKQHPSGQAIVYYTQNSQQAATTLTSVLDSMFDGMNKQFVQVETPFTVTPNQLNARSLSQFDYVFAGLLGFSLIGIGIFGPVNYFPELKKQGVLRRLHTTPLRVWQFFVATVLSNTVVGLLNVIVMFIVAIAAFHLKLVGNIFELAVFLVLSIAMILGIGLAMGGWARNERQVAPLSNIVVFPMMFLSGSFFPRFIMPEWLQSVSNFLPLTPVIDGIRLIATEGAHLAQILPQVGMVAGWLIVIYLIAFRFFRWE